MEALRIRNEFKPLWVEVIAEETRLVEPSEWGFQIPLRRRRFGEEGCGILACNISMVRLRLTRRRNTFSFVAGGIAKHLGI